MPTPTNEEIDAALAENLTGPRKASNETGSIEQHSLTDQIAMDRYRRAKAAAKKPLRGMRVSVIVPPGA
ncbi:MAG TPA: hypothetical protein PKC43_06315 [Phycisphaerales bacterium]|nr:hypothetical protein [Phycisphaerales bacterium]HMP37046.1 hypothetical protein [Phycisphaerales bacterium]